MPKLTTSDVTLADITRRIERASKERHDACVCLEIFHDGSGDLLDSDDIVIVTLNTADELIAWVTAPETSE